MCDSCEVLMINGVKCHEAGCPDQWKEEIRQCLWCGSNFKPVFQDTQFCDELCAESYNS
jgi:hypothetical protein